MKHAFAVLSLCAWALSACSKTNNVSAGGGAGDVNLGEPCTAKADCDGSECVAGFCRRACNVDTDCEAGSICLSDGVASGCRLGAEQTCTSGKPCGNAALVCAIDGSCRMPCSTTCSRDGVVCIAGACVGKDEPGSDATWFSCAQGAGYSGTFCDGVTLSVCNGDAPGAKNLDTCATEGLCAAAASKAQSSCVAPACATDDMACGGPDHATLQRCNADRTGFEDIDAGHTCATAALCAELLAQVSGGGALADCPAPACDVGAGSCQDGDVAECNAGRTGVEPSATCAGSTPQCDPGTKSCIALGIDATEVTRADYAQFLADLGGTTPSQPAACSWNTDFTPSSWSTNDQAQGTLPVSGIDWCDAYAYCAHAGKRLCGMIGGTSLPSADFANPAKSQWMNACTSGGENAYPYGAWQGFASQSTCNGGGNWLSTQTPTSVAVGSMTNCHAKAPGYAGLFDLSGNVAEWEDACDGTAENGSKTDQCHVRGGSYDYDKQADLACNASRVLARNATAPDVGFRCCDP